MKIEMFLLSVSFSLLSSNSPIFAAPTVISNNSVCLERIITANTISGMIFDNNRNALPEVIVELLNEYSSTVGRTRTDGGGRYVFNGLAAGRYYIHILPQRYGFDEQTQEVEIGGFSFNSAGRTLSTSDNITQDFYLRPRRNSLTGLTGASGTVFVQEVPKDAEKSYGKAVELLSRNKTDEGIAQLEDAVRIFPRYYVALSRLGLEKINKNDFQGANIALAVAAEVNPKDVATMYLLGFSLHSSKRDDAALEVLRYAKSMNAKVPRLLLLIGSICRLKGQLQESEQNLVDAKKIDARNELPDIHWQLALLYGNNLKRYTEAADELEIFLKAQPKSRDVENIKKLIKQFRDKADSN